MSCRLLRFSRGLDVANVFGRLQFWLLLSPRVDGRNDVHLGCVPDWFLLRSRRHRCEPVLGRVLRLIDRTDDAHVLWRVLQRVLLPPWVDFSNDVHCGELSSGLLLRSGYDRRISVCGGILWCCRWPNTAHLLRSVLSRLFLSCRIRVSPAIYGVPRWILLPRRRQCCLHVPAGNVRGHCGTVHTLVYWPVYVGELLRCGIRVTNAVWQRDVSARTLLCSRHDGGAALQCRQVWCFRWINSLRVLGAMHRWLCVRCRLCNRDAAYRDELPPGAFLRARRERGGTVHGRVVWRLDRERAGELRWSMPVWLRVPGRVCGVGHAHNGALPHWLFLPRWKLGCASVPCRLLRQFSRTVVGDLFGCMHERLLLRCRVLVPHTGAPCV